MFWVQDSFGHAGTNKEKTACTRLELRKNLDMSHLKGVETLEMGETSKEKLKM